MIPVTSLESAASPGTAPFSQPQGIAVSNSHVWVANNSLLSVTEIDASSGSFVRSVNVDEDTDAVATAGPYVWVANGGGGITEFRASDGALIRYVGKKADGFYGTRAIDIAVSRVWVMNLYGDSVTELNASNGSLVRVIKPGPEGFSRPEGIAVAGANLWVTNINSDVVSELNISNGAIVRDVNAKTDQFNEPDGIAISGSRVWVTNSFSETITELNASNGSLVRVIK